MTYHIAHIGIAVRDAAKTAELFKTLLNSPVTTEETVADQKVRTILFDLDGPGIELLEPTAADSPVAKFLEKRGEGVHHLSLEVDDLEAELVRLHGAGFRMIDEQPRIGAGGHKIAFLHPKSTSGVLIEISQRAR